MSHNVFVTVVVVLGVLGFGALAHWGARAETSPERTGGYVNNSLLPNEHVTFRTSLSSWIFAPAFVLGLVAIVLCFSVGPLGIALGGGLFVSAAIVMIARYIDLKTSEFAVTDKRVIIKVGVLRRRTLEIQLSKVESVAVTQGILGRILGYGEIVVRGTGGTPEPFRNISRPLEFRRAVQMATSESEPSPAAAPVGSRGGDELYAIAGRANSVLQKVPGFISCRVESEKPPILVYSFDNPCDAEGFLATRELTATPGVRHEVKPQSPAQVFEYR